MRHLKYLLILHIFTLVLSLSSSVPMSGEDDEYDDDPELPDRRATMQKLQQEMEEKQEQDLVPASPISSTTPKPPRNIKGHKQKRKWAVAKDIRGYQVLTNGPRVHAEMIKIRPMLKISVELPDHAVRHVEKMYDNRHVELKIRNWNKIYKVHVKVPFGYQPHDLKIAELRDRIEIIAPVYSEIDESSE